jgi:putative addiction module antidote
MKQIRDKDLVATSVQMYVLSMQENTTAKITTSGNSLALRIPKTVADRFGLKAGATVHILQDMDGFRVLMFDPELQRQLSIAAGVQSRNASALRTLADR